MKDQTPEERLAALQELLLIVRGDQGDYSKLNSALNWNADKLKSKTDLGEVVECQFTVGQVRHMRDVLFNLSDAIDLAHKAIL